MQPLSNKAFTSKLSSVLRVVIIIGHIFLIVILLPSDGSIFVSSSKERSKVVICYFCPLLMYFRSFPSFHVSSCILLNREIHSRTVLDLYKYIVRGSMKRDCPSLIRDKTQHSFHLLFFFFCHAFGEAFDIYISYGLFTFAIASDVSYFAAIVTFQWRTSGSSFIHIHCVFILYPNGYHFCFWFRRSGCRICRLDLLFEREFFLSEEFRRFSESSF